MKPNQYHREEILASRHVAFCCKLVEVQEVSWLTFAGLEMKKILHHNLRVIPKI